MEIRLTGRPDEVASFSALLQGLDQLDAKVAMPARKRRDDDQVIEKLYARPMTRWEARRSPVEILAELRVTHASRGHSAAAGATKVERLERSVAEVEADLAAYRQELELLRELGEYMPVEAVRYVLSHLVGRRLAGTIEPTEQTLAALRAHLEQARQDNVGA